MTKVKIESGIPIVTRTSPGKPYIDAFLKMKEGDSFLVPTLKIAANLRFSARHHGFKAATRMLPNGQIRVWKLKPVYS